MHACTAASPSLHMLPHLPPLACGHDSRHGGCALPGTCSSPQAHLRARPPETPPPPPPLQNPVPNAYTLAIAGRKPFIVVHTALLELLTPAEVQVRAAQRCSQRRAAPAPPRSGAP